MYRLPTDPPGFGRQFYQREYRQGYTSTCPSPDALEQLISTGFLGTERDHTPRIAVLKALGVAEGSVVLDYGASWGYGVWQLRSNGYHAIGYDISGPRARYAREMLKVPVFDRVEDLPSVVDVFFSSHVIEHVSAPRDVFSFARQSVRHNGLFVAFTPNGSRARREIPSQAFNVAHMWGQAHPIVLDDVFYRHALIQEPKLLTSSPYVLDSVRGWDKRTEVSGDLSGDELLLVAVLNDRHPA
jgi:2-polyprenyl-3-methyl-5-hydroxy-6-metoxy-1,4-benzoquinol methylase